MNEQIIYNRNSDEENDLFYLLTMAKVQQILPTIKQIAHNVKSFNETGKEIEKTRLYIYIRINIYIQIRRE